jgi:hypothetical protein
MLALALLAGCTSSTPGAGPTHVTPGQPVVSPTPRATFSPPVVAVDLRDPPAGCPGPRLRLRTVSAGYGKLVGSGPLRGGIYAELDERTDAVHAPDAPRTELGWRIKILWVLRPDQKRPVTIDGSDGSPEGPVVFELSEGDPTTVARLDPADPGVPPEKGRWLEFPSYVYFPRAACYRLSARWAGGGWDLGFGFGR